MKRKFEEALCLDDILLVPQYSTIEHRKDVDLSSFLNDREMKLSLPFIGSPMDTVSEKNMAIAMNRMGSVAIIHRYCTIEKQVQIVEEIYNSSLFNHIFPLAAAIGITGDWLDRAKKLYKSGVDVLCLDVAHGDHILMERAIGTIRNDGLLFPVHIMAGNVATAEGFENLEEWGADSIRVGIGGSGVCSTRINTGSGVPNLTALMDCAKVAKRSKIILDGGIKGGGDCVKAYALGADFVMGGSILAGTDECPGVLYMKNDILGKDYRGMASFSAREDNGKNYSIEGISVHIPWRGAVNKILQELEENIKSGLSYSGARNLQELRQKAKFVRQTSLGQKESSTHILERQ